MTSVTAAPCIKTLLQLSARPGRTLEKTAEREQERILGDPLLLPYSPCLEAYSELSWQTKISLFLYNTCFFSPPSSSELRKQNEYMHIQTWIKNKAIMASRKKNNGSGGCTRTKGWFRHLLYL